jgi:tRNA threonylcarbamoyladenosine biosynthesis protein TsaE
MDIKIESLDKIDSVAGQFAELIFFQQKNASLKGITCIAFYGTMGAGKTTFIKALCKVLGVTDIVNSPSFALINEYSTTHDGKIFHFDFYRINKLEEVYDFGYEDYFYSNNLCLIEWPEKIEDLLPSHTLRVEIKELSDMSRMLTIKNFS